ncbi:MAG: ROK family protein [Anaerolineales bacterium]|nr:ROK family protein [Anaerolineales bacterium]
MVVEVNFVIGIDLGGTNVRVGLVDTHGGLMATNQCPIRAEEGVEAGLGRIFDLVEKTFAASGTARLAGIGVGATGPVDPRRGFINNPYTLPGWERVPVVARLQERFQVPVRLENDADAAALGEYWVGAGKGVSRLYAVTVGTGLGTAFVLEGEILRCLDGAHPEGGHHVLDPSGPPCYCGARGCWESLASGSAIARQAQLGVEKHPDSLLLSLASGDAGRIDTQIVAQAALRGDSLAKSVVEAAAEYLALGIVNVVSFFTPEVLVLSGGVMNTPQLFLPAIQAALQKHTVVVPAARVRVLPAALGDFAGLIGAAYTVVKTL